MDEIRITYQEALLYLVLSNVVLGILFGSFPLLAGLKLKNRKYGVFGFFGSILGGAFVGIFLSFPIAAIFFWLIIRKSDAGETRNAVAVEKPVDLPAEISEPQ